MRILAAAASIRLRIFAGFFLVLLLPGLLAAVVWNAGGQLRGALLADAASETTADRLASWRLGMLQTRLSMATYIRTEAAADHEVLNAAIARLRDAVPQAAGSAGEALLKASGTLQAALDHLSNDINARNAAAASLVAASTDLSNAGTALAQAGIRSGDAALAGSSAAVQADIARCIPAALLGAAREEPRQFDAALTGARQMRDSLAALQQASANAPRVQRLAGVLAGANDTFQAALDRLQTAIAARNQGIEGLRSAAAAADASTDELARAITADRHARREASLAAGSKLLMIVVASAGGATILGVAIAALLGLSITRPLGALSAAMVRVAEGALDVAIPGTTARHEIGAMARALEVFKHNAVERRRLEAEEKAGAVRRAAEKRAEMLQLAIGLETAVAGVVKGISDSAAKAEEGAGTVATAVEQTGEQAQAVVLASQQASVGVQNVAGAAEELSASIAEVSRQVSHAAATAREATSAIQNTGRTMQELADAAQRIGDVVGLIQGIAGQTNLLALNATIEAARAGEAGKGFAVVASEVKNLADMTAKSTSEIAAQIDAMRGTTGNAVSAMEVITKVVEQIDQIAAGIAAAVEEQSAATREIARNAQEAATGTGEVTRNISGVSHAADACGGAANEVLGVAQELSGEAERLRSAVDGFLDELRAA